MQYRTLGRTGVQVSTLALGAMNFGPIGNTTQDEATALDTPPALLDPALRRR
jgi:aryl-alcohol dehydrogenase-like predicted oxidoreductase